MNQPTKVLVPRAFADASSYGGLIHVLEDGGRVVAPPVPNRSLNGVAASAEPAESHR